MKTVADMFKQMTYDDVDSSVGEDILGEDEILILQNSNDSVFDDLFHSISVNVDQICRLEERIATPDITKKQIQLALDIGDFYRNLNFRSVGQKTFCQQNIFLGPQSSIFEFICDLLSALRICVNFSVHVHSSRQATAKFICKDFIDSETKYKFELNLRELNHFYCTLYVTESGDLDSAADLLSEAFRDNTSLWKIRNVLVQESIQDEFLAMVKTKIQSYPQAFLKSEQFVASFNDAIQEAESMGLECISNESIPTSVRPTLVIGANRKQLDQGADFLAPVMTLNFFRTTKEGISLLNSENGGSVSIWANQMPVGYEVAHQANASTVWINCFAKFNRSVPYSFRAGGFNYGGDLGVLDRLVKTRSHVPSTNDKFHKINELFECAITRLRSNYVAISVSDHHHFECIASPLQLDDFYQFTDEKVYSNSLQLMYKTQKDLVDGISNNKLANCLFNQLKTICFSFGETFAN